MLSENEPIKLCRDCGAKKTLSEFYKRAKSSYCIVCERARSSVRAKEPQQRWITARSAAKERGIEWALSVEEFTRLASMLCSYCDEPTGVTGSGIDRLDPTLGYVHGNVIACCWSCNRIRSNVFSPAEMRIIGHTLKRLWRTRRLKGEALPITHTYGGRRRLYIVPTE
jgi:hypothetical protein